MALTITNVNTIADDVWGRHRIRLVNVTFDSSYAAGGEAFTPASVGLADIVAVFTSAIDIGYMVGWDRPSQTLRLFGSGTAAGPFDEEAGDQSATTAVVLVIGH